MEKNLPLNNTGLNWSTQVKTVQVHLYMEFFFFSLNIFYSTTQSDPWLDESKNVETQIWELTITYTQIFNCVAVGEAGSMPLTPPLFK